MQRLRVAVLRGGPSRSYDLSLQTGSAALHALDDDRYDAKDILIDKKGEWNYRGLPSSPERILSQIDVALNALHGRYGEDGSVQKMLETYRVPFTGSSSMASATAMNKILAKEYAARAGLRTAPHLIVEEGDDVNNFARTVFSSFPQPWVVKPVSGGSSLGVSVARDFDALTRGIEDAFSDSKQVMVETFLRGKEAAVGMVEGFRGEEQYFLLPAEVTYSPEKGYFDYESKMNGTRSMLVPGRFTPEDAASLREAARTIHDALGLRHYSVADFIVTPHGPYFLEINTLPAITEKSVFTEKLKAVGASIKSFFEHLVERAVRR